MPNLNKPLTAVLALALVIGASCHSGKQDAAGDGSADKDKAFAAFEDRFLDAYWKQHPSASIGVGYGKYYDELTIPDSASFVAGVDFNRGGWIR